MTDREREVLELVRKKPMISQKELAETLGITRSSAAVHISNLLKKGCILGKGYIIQDDDYVSIVGGANIDIQGFPKNTFIPKDSNPGKVKNSLGGVGRNIGENLVKLGVKTKLITAVGSDVYGNKIMDEAARIGLDMNDSYVFKGESTSSYLSILDDTGDMIAAISHMDIFEKINIDLIKEKKHIIENSKLCIIDTNMPKEVIEYIVTNIKDTKYFLDTVSSTKSKRVKDVIGYFHTIKPNRIEAEILSGIEIKDKSDLKKAAEYFLSKGVKRVFISLGEDGIYYNDGKYDNCLRVPPVKVVNTTGAGDAFVAGLAYAYYNDLDIDATAIFAQTASILALSHEDTINPNMSVENINKKIKELNLC